MNTLSATEIAAQTTSGALRCEDVARACLDRIHMREPTVKAWSFLDAGMVLKEAKALDQQPVRGPLHGVPVGVKDVIETCDMPTQMGSPIYRGYQSLSDASCVALLRAAGALIFGKTVTCEFAGVTAGETTNPHDPARTPGGSSSGSGAAVADFMVPLAFGTQTGGSVQRPSSYCGIVGYKPTFGLINPQGVKPAAESLDTVGLMARTVEDVELSARVLTNSDPVTWLTKGAAVRIGLCRTYAWDSAEDATRHAVEDAARRLSAAGFAVRDVDLPEACNDLPVTREIINDFERARGMAYEWLAHCDAISEGLAKSIRNGLAMPRERYIDALQRVEGCRRLLGKTFADVDVLLTPTVQGEAPRGLSYTGDHRFQSIWTQLRTPAITLPTHAGPNGMPVGIQLVAMPYADDKLLAVARLIFDTLGRGPVIEV
ncbi:amidase [Roseiarcaceae bacterium H3SJ34-1]|uniref:amidase n=1 Tax=Terripilifer ovatus TaxID=3032367 RepID=UPI003AB9231D|nr:amidase [Roseiarcaceae bacterium H3SJ34-1]